MILLQDKGQKKGKHEEKNRYWLETGVEVQEVPLPCGDYILGTSKVMDVIFRKDKRGIPVKKMDFLGTYSVTVDTKRDIQELVGDICGKQHARFRDECILAQNNGIRLCVLVENTEGISELPELKNWLNPRLERYRRIERMHSLEKWKNVKLPKLPPTSGETLMKACSTMQDKYGVKFEFCTPQKSGERVIELLSMEV